MIDTHTHQLIPKQCVLITVFVFLYACVSECVIQKYFVDVTMVIPHFFGHYHSGNTMVFFKVPYMTRYIE